MSVWQKVVILPKWLFSKLRGALDGKTLFKEELRKFGQYVAGIGIVGPMINGKQNASFLLFVGILLIFLGLIADSSDDDEPLSEG